jgi:(p)ppGpp synthase/HD superfamily hydrolase
MFVLLIISKNHIELIRRIGREMKNQPVWSQEKYLQAFHFAARTHSGQEYAGSDLPYIMHIVMVCMETIAALEVEPVDNPNLAVQCALLHDVIEDTPVRKKKIAEIFGKDVANGVELLSKKKKITDKEKRFSEYLALLADAPKEIQMVKLADRISNLQAPPFHWDQDKIAAYREKSLTIQKILGHASPYLNARLKEKIADYPPDPDHLG